MQVKKFLHNGKEYETRIISDGETIRIKVFQNGKPANGYSYSVRLDVAFDLKQMIGIDGIKDLIDTAKNDVIVGRWEKYLEAVKNDKKLSGKKA